MKETKPMVVLAYALYITGSLCFLVGSLINLAILLKGN